MKFNIMTVLPVALAATTAGKSIASTVDAIIDGQQAPYHETGFDRQAFDESLMSSDSFGANDSFGGSDSFGANDSFGGSDSFGANDSFGGSDSFGANDSFGGSDSFGAGDSSDTLTGDITPFPTNNTNPMGDFMHLGVLYLEIKRDPLGEFEEYLRVCVKSSRHMIIGTNSDFDINQQSRRYIMKGHYGKNSHGEKFQALKLNLNDYQSNKQERIRLLKADDSAGKYEFYGTTSLRKQHQGEIRAYYKGESAYYYEYCTSTLGYDY
ncbi:hypothetical protein [Pseudoalteromonas sp. OOF1S-7]|uniref:hypothetical protein n=1 Tax=Pseudoalteromonas sp. OOF1S-7 TaxID=2917757 RepID=UPI001EF4F53E|nr:hypothetical protein [Pseudoalteromonas sp. OOF1S-7]MCG7535165.1 hypothetical protein [Pseudoalteromonas sp. OOF1S-7]